MNTLKTVTYIVSIILSALYAYQFLYIPISFMWRRKRETAPVLPGDYAVMICARNEAEVIGDLIRSIRSQDYPQDKLHIFVLADNCTDSTAITARAAGADRVYTRHNTRLVGKGYAMKELMSRISWDFPAGFDGYFVFDADNLLAPGYFEAMNRTLKEGHDVVTGYRNSKNYGDNWISAGYALGFMRECRYMNSARMALGTSCFVSGTGFAFSRRVYEEMGAWPFHTLTEDKEFTIDLILRGRLVAYCPEAEIFDEQPTYFAQSCRQRQRWAKGFIQVFGRYGLRLADRAVHGDISSYDMLMAVFPNFALSAAILVSNLTLALTSSNIPLALARVALSLYGSLFVIGGLTTLTEWNRIHTTAAKKLLYTLTFPVFTFTFMPVAVSAIFARPQWKPIRHSVSLAKLDKSSASAMGLGRIA